MSEKNKQLAKLRNWSRLVDKAIKANPLNYWCESVNCFAARFGIVPTFICFMLPLLPTIPFWVERQSRISNVSPTVYIKRPSIEKLAGDEEVLPTCLHVIQEGDEDPIKCYLALKVLWGFALPDMEKSTERREQLSNTSGLVDALCNVVNSAQNQVKLYSRWLLSFLILDKTRARFLLYGDKLAQICCETIVNQKDSTKVRYISQDLLQLLSKIMSTNEDFVRRVLDAVVPNVNHYPRNDLCKLSLQPAIWSGFAGPLLGNSYAVIDIPGKNGQILSQLALAEEAAIPLLQNEQLQQVLRDVRSPSFSSGSFWIWDLQANLAASRGYERAVKANISSKEGASKNDEFRGLLASRVIQVVFWECENENIFAKRNGFQNLGAATCDEFVRSLLKDRLETVRFLGEATAFPNPEIKAAGVIGLANLVGSDPSGLDTINEATNALDYIVHLLKRIVNQEQQVIGLVGRGWKLWQVCGALCNLCLVKKHRDKLFQLDAVSILTKALSLPVNSLADQWGYENASNVLVQFALDPDYVSHVKSTVNISKLNRDESLRDVAAASNSLESVVQGGLDAIPLDSASSSNSEATRRRVMISYNWSNKPLAERIDDFLKRKGLEIWRDESSLAGNLVDGMARAVVNCDIIISMLSEGYGRSTNCQLEATYATRVCARSNGKKKVIPLLAQAHFDISKFEWLDFLFGGVLYYDVTNDFENAMTAMIAKEIGQEFANNKTAMRSSKVAPAPPQQQSQPAKPAFPNNDDDRMVVVHLGEDLPKEETKEAVRDWSKWLEDHGFADIRARLVEYGFDHTKEFQSLAKLSPKEAVDLLELESAKRGQVVSLLTELRKVFESA